MVNTIDLESQGQIKGGLTKPDILKKYGNSAWRVMTILGLLVSSSCSVTEAQNNISKPAETAPIPGANEPQLAMQPFEINKEYPEALQPYVDVFKNMATKDKLDLNLINNFDFIVARDPAKGTTVEYALMPMAVVNGLTDPDNEPANQKPVYYLAYKDEQGQVIGNYVLGRLLEQDSEGNVSYVSRILADASFQDWLNNTQPADSQIDLGQIVYATALANGIDIKQARKIEQQLTGGELSSADFMKQYALGVSFIQPGQVARQVTIVNPLMPDNTPVEPSIVPSFWSRLFGVQPALAAGLELEATATAPGSTPIIEPTSSAEPTPTIEPTLSAEQQQQVIMNQFVNEPFYDQYIADNQIPEQAATAFYKEYPGADGEPFAVVTMKVDPNSLSEEQKALNIPQRDYLVVTNEDGRTEFKQLPISLQLETFSKSAVEFTLSKEYQKGLQDYLDAMILDEEQVVVTLETKIINGVEHQFILVSPEHSKLNEDQQDNGLRYDPCPLFIMENSKYVEIAIRDVAGNFIGTTASFGDKESSTSAYQSGLSGFGLVSLSSAFSNRYMSENNNPDYWTGLVSSNQQELKIKEMYFPRDTRSAFEEFNGSLAELKVKVDAHFKQRSKVILEYVVKYNMQGRTTIELANEVFGPFSYVGADKNPLFKVYGEDWISKAYVELYNTAINDYGLIPGKDFIVVGINERNIEEPSSQVDYIIGEVNSIKAKIAKDLGIPIEDVPFDIGIEYHLGQKHGARDATLSLSKLTPKNRAMFIQHLQRINKETGSRIHFSEVDAIGNEVDIANAYAELVKIAYDSGVVDSFVFFHALSQNRLDPNEDYQNPLFGEDFSKSVSYYSVIASIYSTLSQ